MTPISINYSNQELRILIEEFIAMQRSEFTFKGVCSYILSYFIVPWKRVELQTKEYTKAINWNRKIAKESVLFWRRLSVKVELKIETHYL